MPLIQLCFETGTNAELRSVIVARSRVKVNIYNALVNKPQEPVNRGIYVRLNFVISEILNAVFNDSIRPDIQQTI